jgi:NADPH:quinone reductase-like Zn-dependent oxidoreductase
MEKTMKRESVWFTGRYSVSVKKERVPPLKSNQILVQTMISAISPGTELLVYRGEAPHEMPADATIPALSGSLRFPLKYGYSAVGRVISTGTKVHKSWRGKTVFALHPHESFFTTSPHNVVELSSEISPEDAVFLSNMETAINLVMDGRPLIRENIVIFGQGIVGLLTTSLLSQFPLGRLVTLDRYPRRRKASIMQGAHVSLDPRDKNVC